MSRRKQARPIRLLEDEEEAAAATATVTREDAASSASVPATPDAPSQVLMCQRCQEQFTELQEYLTHKVECEKKAIKHDDPAHSDPEDMVVSEEDEEDDDAGGKRLERMRRHRQDAANNNSVEENSHPDAGDDGENSTARIPFPFPVPPSAPGHVTLEALQNTKVAVAQFAATAMANNTDNEAALQELAVLQSTLFTLQHQQVLQLQLINQLQQQLQIDRSKATSPVSENASENEGENALATEGSPPPQNLPVSREPTPVPQITLPPTTLAEPLETQTCEAPAPVPSSSLPMHCSISSSFASTIITHATEASAEEPNTLEMLQKRAQEVLDNASQGLLATNLADELAFRKSKGSLSPYDSKGRNEPFFKHRCRYCGKVFGSDSALQIHIRSHTGERPYKCNVCGSRFTTKGNLKVHFQRHSAKFPHIKMNPNPVPEHLDKYHPPLLAQLGQQPSLSPGGPPHPSHLSFPTGPHPFPPSSLPLYRPPHGPPPELINSRLQPSPQRHQEIPSRLFPPHPLFMKREEQEAPENLSKPLRSPTLANHQEPIRMEEDKRTEFSESLTPKQEPNEVENDHEPEPERFSSPPPYDDCSIDSKYSNEDNFGQRSPTENMQDEPENLSNKSNNSISVPLSISTGQRLPANFSFGQVSSPPSSASSGSLGPFPTTPVIDPAKDPAIYSCLLPRPGSNDNSWESLIEVTKPSETTKLQQLVDNIEHKLSDPNQCVICHRVLSCKSALQMHYRTHTGERPFKCKICGRAFTTKGNLKTHMGVHRAKPPMRVLHQCPVCHKKFTNALVLQQHIRLHTGEPTDLTVEQINAAEVKEFPSPGGPFPSLPNSMHPFLGPGFTVPGLSPMSMAAMHKYEKDEHESMDEDDYEEDDVSNSEHQHNNRFSTSPADVPTSLGYSAEDLCSSRIIASSPVQNGEKSPCRSGITSPGSSELRSSPNVATPVQVPRPPSSQQAGSPTPSECNSMGALDLTPKSLNQPLITSPGPSPGPPPSLFSTFGLLPPGQATSPLISSALSSLTSSVLTSTAFSPLRLAVGGPSGRGNTTCNLCFKTFACNSALEIHYRSHTKERPFKCTVCDRGFSTKERCACRERRIQDEMGNNWKRKPSARIIPSVLQLPMSPGYASNWMHSVAGNMKQHMLTHKIRDMPQHMFDNKMSGDESSQPHHQPPSSAAALPIQRDATDTSDMAASVQQQQQNDNKEPQHQQQQPVKREPTETELPLPKRPPSLQASKHLCHVCNKNFSSSSALQIHMRTHTGDKPFRCTVCQKAFTTKGNLKVHMGTHMWSNGASRRGRRMSLDLPPIPMTPKDSEFLQRRPDLFYPYLPAPFLNGMQQKLNEMSSVVQPTQNGLSGGGGKYGNLLSFGYPPPEALRSHSGSPDRPERAVSRDGGASSAASTVGADAARSLWDLHFDRKSTAETAAARDTDLIAATTANNREGLAA